VSTHLIGIAQMRITKESSDVLTAPNLGSCVAVAVFDPIKKIGGMIHCLLPMSKSDPAKAKDKPEMYVDTGVALLLESILALGSTKKDLQIIAAGGAQINDPNNVFEIGKKNIVVLKKILWKNNLLMKASDFGEDYSRTVTLDMKDGRVTLKAKGDTKLLG
jgi:chemotaxis protein CheD